MHNDPAFILHESSNEIDVILSFKTNAEESNKHGVEAYSQYALFEENKKWLDIHLRYEYPQVPYRLIEFLQRLQEPDLRYPLKSIFDFSIQRKCQEYNTQNIASPSLPSNMEASNKAKQGALSVQVYDSGRE